MRTLLLLILATPLIEIALFIKIGQTFGVLPTLLGVVASAAIGLLVIQNQGLALAGKIRLAMDRGEMPARTVADAMMVFAAGVLLLVPGYFTDLIGLLLLLPPLREWLYTSLARRVKSVAPADSRYEPGRGPRVIELDDDSYRER